jgi:DNA-binding NtrC family response regulator
MHSPFSRPEDHFRDIGPGRFARIVGRMADVALVVDGKDRVDDVSCSIGASPAQIARDWTGAALRDIVDRASAAPASQAVSAARAGDMVEDIELVHPALEARLSSVRYSAFALESGDRVVLLGRVSEQPVAPSYRDIFDVATDGGDSPALAGLASLVGTAPLKTLVASTRDTIERMCIEAALRLTNNNRAAAARTLGISRQALYLKLERYGLDSDPS